jgi:hypothetical protein
MLKSFDRVSKNNFFSYMKVLNLEQMEKVNGGSAKSNCAWAIASNALALVGFIGTGGIGLLAWVALASYGISSVQFVDACKGVS